MQQTISVGESIRFGWETFKKRPWFFVGIVLLVFILSSVLSAISNTESSDAMGFVIAVAVVVVNLIIEIGLIAFALKAHDDIESVTVHDLWHPQSFWPYLGVKILTMLIVLVGLVLLIVPGIMAAIALLFATYLVIDRGMGPIDAIKESVAMTKGHRWALFVLVLAIAGLNILGALMLGIGLLVSVPVSLLAIVHVYRILARAHASSGAAA